MSENEFQNFSRFFEVVAMKWEQMASTLYHDLNVAGILKDFTEELRRAIIRFIWNVYNSVFRERSSSNQQIQAGNGLQED